MESLKGVVPAVRKIKDFEKLLKSNHGIIILLETRIAQLPNLVKYAKKFDKKIIVHLDLINGLKVDQYGMELLVHHMKVDGVISTRGNIISMAKKAVWWRYSVCLLLTARQLRRILNWFIKQNPIILKYCPELFLLLLKKLQIRQKLLS